jgi:hypothetical protein
MSLPGARANIRIQQRWGQESFVSPTEHFGDARTGKSRRHRAARKMPLIEPHGMLLYISLQIAHRAHTAMV